MDVLLVIFWNSAWLEHQKKKKKNTAGINVFLAYAEIQ